MSAARLGDTTARRHSLLAHHTCSLRCKAFFVVITLLFHLFCWPANALNTCEEITRCSECVYDQTQGIMRPSLLCAWCESSQSCKEVNASVLAYYGLAQSTTTATTGDDDSPIATLTPEAMAAFRASFCKDLRERDLNGACPDMSCTAAWTTNNIYICRPPPLIALVFGCILFVLSLVTYLWMRAIRQLPWKYEPFLSDLLEGRSRSYEVAMEEEEREASTSAKVSAVAPTRMSNNDNNNDISSSGISMSPLTWTRDPPLRDGVAATATLSHAQANVPAENHGGSGGSGEDESEDDSDAPSAETASTISNPSYLDSASHSVVVAHHPRVPSAAPGDGGRDGVEPTLTANNGINKNTSTADVHIGTAVVAAAAATGYCPICKCRQPACLGPGEVCFWCNIARFSFAPFFTALLTSVFVVVLHFAVSLKPWFADWYFAAMLLIAYAAYGALGYYMMSHHKRVPLFFFESEAERRANQQIWTKTHDRPATRAISRTSSSSKLSPGIPASSSNYKTSGGTGASASTFGSSRRCHNIAGTANKTGGDGGCFNSGGTNSRYHHHRCHGRQRLQLLNDARRNMSSTYYFQLALKLRGRPLLTCFPELKQYEAQVEAMQASPTTLTAVGDAVAVMRPVVITAAATAGGRATLAPGSPHGVPQNTNAAAVHLADVPIINVPIISPFAAAVSAAEYVEKNNTESNPLADGTVTAYNNNGDAPDAFPSSVSSPSVSYGVENARLPLLAHVGTTTPSPALAAEIKPDIHVGSAIFGETASTSLPPPASATAVSPVAAVATATYTNSNNTAATISPGAPVSGPIGSPAATNVPVSLARQKRGETVQLLSSDFLSPQYCRALKSTLYRDEYITWCSKPNLRGVLMESEWLLLDLAVGFLFGAWMVMLSSVSDTSYAIVQLIGSTAVAACGLIVMILFAVLLFIVVRQCGRLYVLTNERLITVYESVVTPVTTATDLSTVRFAALYGYRGLWSKYPCLTFSWEVPATERKMPVIKSHKFPGIMHLQEFLFFFRLVAPQTPFHLEQISQSMKQDRQEWRLHIFLSIAAFIVLPIVTIYPQAMPDFLGFFVYVLGLLLIFSTLLRGLRAQQMTCAPLNIAALWAPEGELNELNATDQSRALPLPTPPPTHPQAPPPQQQQQQTNESTTQTSPLQRQQPEPSSPTSQQTPPQYPLKEGDGVGSRTEQIATTTAQSPVMRTVPGDNSNKGLTGAAGTSASGVAVTVAVGSPCGSGANEVAVKDTIAASANLLNAGPQVVSDTNSILSPKLTKPILTTTSSSTLKPTISTGVSPVAVTTSNTIVNTLPFTAVPVTVAVREMEESLTGHFGLGLTGGGLSAYDRSSNSMITHVGTGGSRGETLHNSPYRLHPSNIEVTGGFASGVNREIMSVSGLGVSTPAGGAADTGKATVGGNHNNSNANASKSQTNTAPGTANSTACSSPTNPAPSSGLLGSFPLSSDSRHPGLPQGHDHGHLQLPSQQQQHQQHAFPHPGEYAGHHWQHSGMSRSGSEGVTSNYSTDSPATVTIVQHSGNISNGGGNSNVNSGTGGAASASKFLHPSSLAHVVPASVRSVKPDGHTTWGDQVGGHDV